jgi:hypothetical protein
VLDEDLQAECDEDEAAHHVEPPPEASMLVAIASIRSTPQANGSRPSLIAFSSCADVFLAAAPGR